MQVCNPSSQINSLNYEILRIRMIEEEIANRYGEQKMRCPIHLSIGQEAVAVGVCSQIKKTDFAISNHRAHAHYLAKGGDLKKMIAEIYGKKTGCCQGRGGSMHLIDLQAGFLGSTPIVGGSIPVGVGAAFASKLRNEEQLTVIFFGEGSTEEGVFSESLNFASLHNLPVLFICENNLYSVYSPLSVRQSKNRDICLIAKANGIWAQSGNGNDVEEVSQLSGHVVNHIRQNRGPCLLEFFTYRMKEHCGPFSDHYQPKREKEFWQKQDPVAGIDLEAKQIIAEEIEEAFKFAEESDFPQWTENEEAYASS